MNILLLKLLLVPFFIGLMSIVAKKFGSNWAGIFGGMPVVGGPILIILILENGTEFGTNASIAAVASAAAYICFGIAYSHLVKRYNWQLSMLGAVIIWSIAAWIIMEIKPDLILAIIISFFVILSSEFLMPDFEKTQNNSAKSLNLPVRMFAGVALTLLISAIAHIAGSRLSGLLALYPILGTIMLVSTHKSFGYNEAIKLFRGMSRGAYSILGFFGSLAYFGNKMPLILAILIAIFAALLIQAIVVTLFLKQTRA